MLLLLISAFFYQCMSPENPKGKSTDSERASSESSKISNPVNSVIQEDDQGISDSVVSKAFNAMNTIKPGYSTFIPSSVNTEDEVPVIFIFDPHANGQLPIEKYKNLAEEFGFVLVGSNKSQNGQAIEDGLVYYNEMKNAIAKKLTVNESRIFTLGFSGGARVAVSIAIQIPEIDAVIGCGAGFPAVRQLPNPNFYYFGMVGYEDFNLGELINNDRNLRRSGFQNELAIFDGGHDWPDEAIMREAFLAIQINDIRQQVISRDEQLIRLTIDYYNTAIKDFTDSDRYFDAAEMAARAASVLKGVGDTKSFESLAKSSKKNAAYSRDLSAMVKTMEVETGKQNNYLSDFETKDMAWWKNEITKIKTPVDDIYQDRLNKRLNAYLGLLSFMMSNKAISEKNWIQAQKNINVYRMVEPVNPEHAYLNAIVKMNTGDEAAAEGFLQQAIVLGFNDTNRFLNEPSFDDLERKNQFLEMMK